MEIFEKGEDESSESSQNLDNVEDNSFTQNELANERIEQEAEASDHTKASDIHVKDTSEPAPPGQPKSIANDDDHH